ncbi:MAG TPA: tyrosine-type recombinase/integrase [Solirubrobacteraceae bacterium]|jgi:integrase|nr:tyrosine-type recombinase/integrase [Solirubrobacteraceae bacterium]
MLRLELTRGWRPNALNDGNVRKRILAKAVERANEHLEKVGSVPLPHGLTPHKLRDTFASLLVALGTDPGAVMDELGHTDPGFTLRVYRHGMRRDQRSKDRLSVLVGLEAETPAEVSGTNSGTNGQNEGALQSDGGNREVADTTD